MNIIQLLYNTKGKRIRKEPHETLSLTWLLSFFNVLEQGKFAEKYVLSRNQKASEKVASQGTVMDQRQ